MISVVLLNAKHQSPAGRQLHLSSAWGRSGRYRASRMTGSLSFASLAAAKTSTRRNLCDGPRLLRRGISSHAPRRLPVAATVACPLVSCALLSGPRVLPRCEAPAHATESTSSEGGREALPMSLAVVVEQGVIGRIRYKARRALRMLGRAVQLLLTLGPLAVVYPVARTLKSFGLRVGKEGQLLEDGGADGGAMPDWYLNLCLWCVETSGAAVIKLMQWASSRPDMFGDRFCEIFNRLQDSTTPHAWPHTEEVLEHAYGEEWSDKIHMGELLGSGCIGQVYGAVVDDADGVERHVAVKVMHPGVKKNIDADLDLLRFLANTAESMPFNIGAQFRWLDLSGIVEEFRKLMTHQLDFRTEAANLRRFNENFADDEHVVFPEPVNGFDAREDILVETFCEGLPFTQWCEANQDNKDKRRLMCITGIKAVCKMIFYHNFIHGDLHPGNIFVSNDGNKFILLDTGMATEYDDYNHDRIISILTSFIRKDGNRAGKLLIKDSNKRTGDKDTVLHEEAYIAKIKAMTDECKDNPDTYMMKALGTYISRIMDAAATHHVLMNPSFVSCALAVKVLEGVAMALDPAIEISRVANPIILNSEIRRKALKVKKQLGFAGGRAGILGASSVSRRDQDAM